MYGPIPLVAFLARGSKMGNFCPWTCRVAGKCADVNKVDTDDYEHQAPSEDVKIDDYTTFEVDADGENAGVPGIAGEGLRGHSSNAKPAREKQKPPFILTPSLQVRTDFFRSY